jgi:hypothetical protein
VRSLTAASGSEKILTAVCDLLPFLWFTAFITVSFAILDDFAILLLLCKKFQDLIK